MKIIVIILLSISFSSLITPSRDDELNYIHVLFEWEQEEDATLYNLQVSTSSSFNNKSPAIVKRSKNIIKHMG